MRSGFKTIVSFAIGVFLATVCTEQARTTTSVPIRCLNGRIVTPAYGSQYCACNAGFLGNACDQFEPTADTTFRCINGIIVSLSSYYKFCMCKTGYGGRSCEINWFPPIPPPIRCVNGVITNGTVFQYCMCDIGFTGAACDVPFSTTPPPIRCVNGLITKGAMFQYCMCNIGFTGAACDMPIPTIRCVHGEIANAGTLGQYCVCNPGFIGEECDIDDREQTISIICKLPYRCVNGVITHAGTSYQRCECNPGFTGAACDVHMPMEKLSQTDLIVGVSVGALILVAVILAAVLFCKRRQRLNNQQSAAHARRQPRDIRTGFSHGIYAIPGDLDFKLPPYTPPNFPPPYDHLDNKSAGLVGGQDSLSQPPPYYSNPGYQTMSSVRKESVGNEVVSVRFE